MTNYLICFVFYAVFPNVKGYQSGDQLLLLHDNTKGSLITQLDLTTKKNLTLALSDHQIVVFDYHLEKLLLFWATPTKIYRSSAAITTQVAEVGSVGGLAVDWVHDRLYWTDPETEQIEAASLDGSGRQVLYKGGQPTSVSVDPLHKRIFWLDNHSSLRKIRYANLDGSIPKGESYVASVLWVSAHLSLHSPLNLDLKKQLLYFTQTQYRETTVMLVDYRHTKSNVAAQFQSPSPALAVLDGRVYWSNTTALYWTSIKSKEVGLVSKHVSKVHQIKAVSHKLQPTTPDKCLAKRCSQDCFNVDDVPTCACHFGYSLQPELSTCCEDGFAVLHSDNSIYRVTLPSVTARFYPAVQLLYNNLDSQISSIDIHFKRNLLFWTDSKLEALFMVSLEKPSDPQIFASGDIKSVAVDWVNDHVYWAEKTKIHMGTIDGCLQLVVTEDPNEPQAIGVDPVNRLLFWSTCGFKKTIVKAALDGSNRNELKATDSCATNLRVSSKNKHLYWIEHDYHNYFSMFYDGYVRQRVVIPRIQDAVNFGSKVLWTDTSHQHVFINQSGLVTKLDVGFKPKGLVVFSSLSQPKAPLYCRDTECTGICVPGIRAETWDCLCQDDLILSEDNITCLLPEEQDIRVSALRAEILSVRDYDSSSVTLDFNVVYFAKNFFITITPTASYQLMDPEKDFSINVQTASFPVKILGLQPATSYSVSMTSDTDDSVMGLEFSTAPPPLHMSRLPQVYKPMTTEPISWLPMPNYFDYSQPWQILIKEFFLLILPDLELAQMDEVESDIRPAALLQRIVNTLNNMNVKNRFAVLKHYHTKVEFDRSPTVSLNNFPYGVEFFLAMVQVSEYNKGYGIDITFSEKTKIAWPN